ATLSAVHAWGRRCDSKTCAYRRCSCAFCSNKRGRAIWRQTCRAASRAQIVRRAPTGGLAVTPFEYLGNEHHELARMLTVLQNMAKAVEAGAEVDRGDIDAVMEYLREVGDLSHHDKEETLLVPALVRQNMDWFHG